MTSALPEIAFYYPGPVWRSGDWVKTLLLFFDGIALLVPRYLHDKPLRNDPVLAEPLQERGLLHVLEPETFIDQASTEHLTEVLVDLITSGAFDRLERNSRFHELSYSRLGGMADASLAEMVLDDLKKRNLARASEDGVSIPMHPLVRATVLVLLAQILREPGQRRGMALQPVTDRQELINGLLRTLRLPQLPSAGHVIALDREQVSLNLAKVPLEEVLEFRAAHGLQHRSYMRNLRRFLAELAGLDEPARKRAFVDRREELADAADELRRLARTYWRKPLAGFGLGLAGAAWTAHQGDVPTALLSLGAGLLSLQGLPHTGSAYSPVHRPTPPRPLTRILNSARPAVAVTRHSRHHPKPWLRFAPGGWNACSASGWSRSRTPTSPRWSPTQCRRRSTLSSRPSCTARPTRPNGTWPATSPRWRTPAAA
jgi:hypothetical protein